MKRARAGRGGGLSAWSPRVLSTLRIATAATFMVHGSQKLLGFPPRDGGAVQLASLMGLAGVLELLGGFLVLIGFLTRPVAFVLSGFMAVAYWTAHAPRSLYPAVNGGDAAILYCFVFLYLVFAGPGPWSVDERRG